MGTPVCADDPSGDKNVLITRAAPRWHTSRVQVNAVIHMHFDCIRQTSGQTRQAGFDVTDHPLPSLPFVSLRPSVARSRLYIAHFAKLIYSILDCAFTSSISTEKCFAPFSESEILIPTLHFDCAIDAPRQRSDFCNNILD